MEIIDLIKAQCRVQGVSEKFAERIEKLSGITEEKDGNIIAAVKSFKENVMPLIDENKTSAEEAARRAIEEYEKKHGLNNGKPKEEGGVELPDDLDPAIRAIIENQAKAIEKMTQSIDSLSNKQKQASTLALVKEKLKGRIADEFIPNYIGQIDLSAENIDAEIDKIVNTYTEMQQKFINNAVESGKYQPIEGGSSGAEDKDIDAFIESKSKGPDEGPFAGIKL